MPCLQGPGSKTDADGAASQRYVDIEIGREGERGQRQTKESKIDPKPIGIGYLD